MSPQRLLNHRAEFSYIWHLRRSEHEWRSRDASLLQIYYLPQIAINIIFVPEIDLNFKS